MKTASKIFEDQKTIKEKEKLLRVQHIEAFKKASEEIKAMISNLYVKG